jgi:hypothetical protein
MGRGAAAGLSWKGMSLHACLHACVSRPSSAIPHSLSQGQNSTHCHVPSLYHSLRTAQRPADSHDACCRILPCTISSLLAAGPNATSTRCTVPWLAAPTRTTSTMTSVTTTSVTRSPSTTTPASLVGVLKHGCMGCNQLGILLCVLLAMAAVLVFEMCLVCIAGCMHASMYGSDIG